MVIYSCPDCDKKFKDKQDYTRHLNRKNSCIKKENDNKYVCNICNKVFSSQFSMKRHQREICIKKQNEEILLNKIKEIEETLYNLKNNKSNIKNIQNVNTTNNNNNIYNNIQQNINNVNNYFNVDTLPVGKEDVSFLTDKGIINMLKIMDIEDIHSNLIEIINFNKNKLNNHNVVRYNKKYYLLLEFDNKNKKLILNTNNIDDLTEKYIMRNIDLIEDRLGVMIENKNPEIIAIEKKVDKYNENTDNIISYYNDKNNYKNTEVHEKIKKIKDKVEKLIINDEVNKEINLNDSVKSVIMIEKI
jgi:hypothetical protein